MRPPPNDEMSLGRVRTFLALARASVHGAEHSDVALCVQWTKIAGGLGFVLLVDVPEDVAVNAAELPLLGLKVACVAHAASVLQVRPIEVRKRIFQMIFV